MSAYLETYNLPRFKLTDSRREELDKLLQEQYESDFAEAMANALEVVAELEPYDGPKDANLYSLILTQDRMIWAAVADDRCADALCDDQNDIRLVGDECACCESLHDLLERWGKEDLRA